MRIVTLISLLFTTLTVFGQINSGSPAIPFGSKISVLANPYGNGIVPTNLPTGAYNPESGQYGKSQDAAEAYNTWKTNYVEACGTNFRVKFDNAAQTVSEGIGYGMLISAYAGDKTLFDGLWGYYKANSNGNGVMNWRTGACTYDQNGGATDADLDAAMALLIAKCQWPSATSPYNYNNEATSLITAIKNTEIHNTSFQAINGDGWGFGNNCRNPGYQAPAYYRQFAGQVSSQSPAWNSAVTAAYTLVNANRNTTTGLVTNWSDQNGVANNCNGGAVEYGYDACRSPWRMATDVLWYANSTAQTNFCIPIASYVTGKGSDASGPIPQAGGTGKPNEATFSSMYAAGICGADATYQPIMNSMYTKTVGTVDELPRYFGNTLRVISLFMQTGNFWKPCVAAPLTVSVALTAPISGQTVSEGDAITLTATASTSNGTIAKVEFYNGTTLIGTATSSPYTISWTAVPAGTNQILAKAYNVAGETASTTSVPILVVKSIYLTATVPTIDGIADAIWGGSNTSASLNNLIGGSVGGAADLSANYKAMWDANYFYLLVDVTDNVKTNNGSTDIYNDDAVEVFFDIGNLKATSYGAKDFQYTFRWDDKTVYELNNKTTGVTFGKVDNLTGYVMEMRFPWSTLTGSPAINQLVGFDVQVDDDDDGGSRDGKISWASSADQAWQNPSYMGTAILKGIPCTSPAAAGAIIGSSSVCQSDSVLSYSIEPIAGATSYEWTVPTGATIISGANTNTITVTFGFANGSVSVTPKNACGSGTSNSKTITVAASITPTVSIATSQTTVCASENVSFTATPVYGGTPSYQWRKNGVPILGATASTYATASIANNDKFDVVMTSTETCRSVNTANASQITIIVNPSVTPTVSIATSKTTVCASENVNFTATPLNGGTPSFQWRKNGAPISGATGVTYTATNILNNDKFDVVMTSTETCRSVNTANASQITIIVTPSVTPTVSITASKTTICNSENVNFIAAAVSGGIASYQWRKNGTPILGATAITYATSDILTNDVFDVVLTSSATCRSANTANASPITITVTPKVTPTVSIEASKTTVCPSESVSFTARSIDGGIPTYQWRKNGLAISGATSETYATASILNNEAFDVIMTSTAACSFTSTANSPKVTMTLIPSESPTVSVTASTTTICSGSSVTFTASALNAGTPTYQWKKNDAKISGETNATLITSTISNNDKFSVVVTSNALCRTVNTAASEPIAIATTTIGNASVTISVSPANTVYEAQSLTFIAIPVNGGTNPTYQWKNGTTEITGATNATYTTSILPIGNNSINVAMTSNASCVTVKKVNAIAVDVIIKQSPNFDDQIDGDTNVVANQTNVTYSVANQAGMTYAWTVPSGAVIVSGQNTASIVVNFGTESGYVRVEEMKPAGQTTTISSSVQIENVTPIDVSKNGIIISVYPIPCNDIVYISLDGITEIEGTYTLVDMTGNVVRSESFVYSGIPVEIKTDFASGVYQVILQWNGNTTMTRIVKY